MTIPQWTLLGFAAWTLALLMATVGVYRWGNILLSKARIASFRSDQLEGDDWYRRGTRAHANCIENLPVFGAIVFVITAIGLQGPTVDALCIAILVARICQSSVHVSHVQTDAFVAVRFSFYSVQLLCFLVLIVMATVHGGVDVAPSCRNHS
ncbi:MAG TPA: MAPEG family protein [Steroidobacteraceae bacterium]|nr:MAPEG family protein [Steroidobacteraceae bacterium]